MPVTPADGRQEVMLCVVRSVVMQLQGDRLLRDSGHTMKKIGDQILQR